MLALRGCAGFSLVAGSGGHSLVRCLLLLRSAGSRARGLRSLQRVAAAPGSRAHSAHLWCTGFVALRHVGSSQTRDWTRVSCIGRWILHPWATREAPTVLLNLVFRNNLWLLPIQTSPTWDLILLLFSEHFSWSGEFLQWGYNNGKAKSYRSTSKPFKETVGCTAQKSSRKASRREQLCVSLRPLSLLLAHLCLFSAGEALRRHDRTVIK